MTDKLLGQILLESTSLDADALKSALEVQSSLDVHRRIGRLLVEQGLVSEEDVMRALAEQWSLPFLNAIDPNRLDRSLVRDVPLQFLKKRCILPVLDGEDGIVIVTADPLDVESFDSLANVLGPGCKRAICMPDAIEEAISRYFYQHAGEEESAVQTERDEPGVQIGTGEQAEDLLNLSATAPIIKMVNSMFFQAARSRASDIHLEYFEEDIRVRFRIDGVLHEAQRLALQNASALVSRLKVMANLDIAEKRLPQDGRCKIKIGDDEIDIRLSIIPTSRGERVVLRLLDKSTARLDLGELGFSASVASRFRSLVKSPHGIILVTGPTGSGKTTTLYSSLRELNTEERNILTVEDPIEYELAGVGQMQIRPQINLTFANCLRHLLRHDPDVIMVGEIRDPETADMAIRAALTGHMVFSTLHTNDSVTAITRLLDMGVEPYLVSSSILAILAQRLVRVICPHCKVETPIDEQSRFALRMHDDMVWSGRGCEKCLQTGFRGRISIGEFLEVNEDLRERIMSHVSATELKRVAVAAGMKTLREEGLDKVRRGITTPEEVIRVTQESQAVEEPA